eukprot:TRINITY_DN1881_c0_g2_i2.p1 TRINITY_DN1881_c0_g2~~TRINITY_DN1881_c0_g2_i2.p1  ORF type:complete len:410 (+),score=82.74 TRINITY_DN1881_c0_g2_i2:222-1451(+)
MMMSKKLKKKELDRHTSEVTVNALNHIQGVENLIRLAQKLTNDREYLQVLTVGQACEEAIEARGKELEQREKIKKEYQDLDAQRLANLVKPDKDKSLIADLEEKIEKAKKAVESLPNIDFDHEKLNRQLLEITDLMIAAAKAEDKEEVMREQTILAFKADTSPARWEAVKNLTSEDEWEKVKQDLVLYVMKRDDNPKDKIELLLKDGLFDHCISIFPSPSGAPGELDLLYDLYDAAERNKPSVLEHLLPKIASYMKRYFQEHRFEAMNKILDRVQRRFPSVVVGLYTQACDMVLINIMPSQYGPFVQCLKDLKKRLCDVSRHEDWNNFYHVFKEKHKGKKRLIQMLALIGDSQWDLKEIMSRSAKKRRVKRERVKREKGHRRRKSSGSIKTPEKSEAVGVNQPNLTGTV